MMRAQMERTLNIIRGKNLVGMATKEDINLLFEHIDALEDFLDQGDYQYILVPYGWRHHLGVDA